MPLLSCAWTGIAVVVAFLGFALFVLVTWQSTIYGLHLIKCIRRIPVKTLPLEECRRELSQKLLNYKLNKTLQQAVDSGKKTMDVEVMVNAQ